MAYNYSQFNTVRAFDFEAPYDLSDASVYKKLEELYTEDGEGAVYKVRAIYINKKTKFKNKEGEREAPVILLDDCAVNVPSHQTGMMKAILADPEACEGINDGECFFTIRKYHQRAYDKDCYAIQFED